MISSQIFQNAPIISSIISIFLPIIKCDFDHKSCSKGSKNDVLKTISSQIILKTLRYPSSTVLLPRLTSNVSYYQWSQIMIMKQKSSVRAFSRSYTYPNHLVFANYMLKHLYQIMIRRLMPYILRHLAIWHHNNSDFDL